MTSTGTTGASATRLGLADGGIETALTERLGQRLPEFAAFTLLDSVEGREALREYYRPFLRLAVEHGRPIVLDTPTWRSNTDWGERLGYDQQALDAVNADAVALLRELVEDEGDDSIEAVVNGCVGPRFDDHYIEGRRMTAAEAEAYHAPQVNALAEAGADRVTAVTTLDAAEGIGVVRAAQSARIPVAVSFVVGEDGLLADGSTLAEAIAAVDAQTEAGAIGFLVNCAHPTAVAEGLEVCGASPELSRLIGFRLNAAHDGDEGPGDGPESFAELEAGLRELAPNASIFGGCCGTDTPHIAALASRLA
ncbi:homocysteine methyltransferase [Leucobacter sp. UCD-THU]|uniref:homocysteine S-methyltransferase family protein n=1 Tax=Leucobacter sp. UCD-THU TaxID=1292023 RepID=UPI000382410C|nr:homocysteine S-methyltransferase family protein [Leucobacter sp. UCD-THU]EYT56562.1 homocysteine methyltransferase [Leucobacter sp. UCD-THU]